MAASVKEIEELCGKRSQKTKAKTAKEIVAADDRSLSIPKDERKISSQKLKEMSEAADIV